MDTIHKHALPNVHNALTLPEGATVLSAKVSKADGQPYLWVKVNPKNPPVQRLFLLIATGCAVPRDVTFIDTLQSPSGKEVLHLFEHHGNTVTG